MSHLALEGEGPADIAVRAELVVGQGAAECPGAIEHPAAEGSSRGSPPTKIFIGQRLELLIRFVGEIRPVNLESEHRKCKKYKHELPHTNASVRDGLSKAAFYLPGKIALE